MVLGHGWTGSFLLPACKAAGLSTAVTTRDGRDGSIRWTFDPAADDGYDRLPSASTVVIVFPITAVGGSERLTSAYRRAHPDVEPLFVQLGSAGAFDLPAVADAKKRATWIDRHSPVDLSQARVAEEKRLLELAGVHATVLNLGGLWGGERSIRNVVGRVAPTKDALRGKGSIHMIHGDDVAGAIVAVAQQHLKATGQRWLLNDMRVLDWCVGEPRRC